MATVALRQVGGSVAMVIPPVLLQALKLKVGSEVNLILEEQKLVVDPVRKKVKYRLEDLLAQSDFESAKNAESDAWINEPSLGNELL